MAQALRQPGNQVADRRDAPLYSLHEAAQYLGVPKSTLQSWVAGRTYRTRNGEQRHSQPLIEAAVGPAGATQLSFFNMVEAHILLATRKTHGIHVESIRNAIDYVREQFPANVAHPLLTHEFHTDASKMGQVAFGDLVNQYLELIERDAHGLPLKFYPARGNRSVVISPALSSGRPVVRGTGVLASIIAQRVDAGEKTIELAENYGVPESDILAALAYAKAA